MRIACVVCVSFLIFLAMPVAAEGTATAEILVIGGDGANCEQDPHCINRLHPAIPMTPTRPKTRDLPTRSSARCTR